jgi:predicted dehydrogenase
LSPSRALGCVLAGIGQPGQPADAVGFVSLLGPALFAPTTVLTTGLGVRLAHAVARRRLKLAFGIFLAFVSLRFLYAIRTGYASARQPRRPVMPKPICWGILGAAKIAREFLAPAMVEAVGAELAALATTDAAKAGPFLARYPHLRVVEGYDALLDDPEIDAIYIPLPNHLHVEWTEKALDAGKHVLCEKPISLDLEGVDRLIGARNRAGCLAAEGFMVLHHPQWLKTRQLLADGAIGRLVHVAAAFHFRNTDPSNIRNQVSFGGGGLHDIGVYPCATTRFATGSEPERLAADIRRENRLDTFARVWADFPDFTMAFTCGIRQAPRQEIVFHGEEGWIRLESPFNARVYGDTRLDWRGPDGTINTERFNGVDQYKLLIESFVRSVREGDPFPGPLEFSRGNQMMIDAIFRSESAGGAWVPIAP